MFGRVVLRTGNDDYLPGVQQTQTNRIDRHQVGQRLPLTCYLCAGIPGSKAELAISRTPVPLALAAVAR